MQTFNDYVARLKADGMTVDDESLQQAVRYYVSERTDFKPEESLRQEMAAALGDAALLDGAVHVLGSDTTELNDCCRTLIAQAWDELDDTEHIARAVADSKEKLFVLEPYSAALCTMYLAYLLGTKGGIKKIVRKRIEHADGRIEEATKVEYATFPESFVDFIKGVVGK